MKKMLLVGVFMVSLSCYKSKDSNYNDPPSSSQSCGSHNGKALYKDDHGCYFIDESGNKSYVEMNECNC